MQKTYTIEPKINDYDEETRKQALKLYYSGVSGRGVGKILGMSKSNVYNWIKKALTEENDKVLLDSYKVLELDELYWFVGKKSQKETRENVYIITMVSREPRQFVGFEVAIDKNPERIQKIVDGGATTEKYCTDGYNGYVNVAYFGKHIRNINDKSDMFTVEGINADLRYYIPILARRSRCFPRRLETLQKVVEMFVCAYNKFGVAKLNYRKSLKNKKSRELPFSVIDFL